MGNARSLATAVLLLAVSLFLSSAARAAGGGVFFEPGAGVGADLNGLGAKMLLIVPALSVPIKGAEMLRFRLEGNIELIERRDRTTVISGIAPFFRMLCPGGGIRPFVELGGGVNYSSRKSLDGDRLRGPYLFSGMGGAGIEFLYKKRPVSFSYRARHLSNASLYKTNHGLNSQYLMVIVGF